MYPRKVVALQKSKPLSSKDEDTVGFIAVQNEIDCGNK